MAVTLNASASAGLVATADTSTILQLQTAGTTAVTVNASQNVGIGTTSPIRPLQVGSYGSGNGEIALGASTTGYNSILFGDSSANFYQGYVQYQHNGDFMVFATAATERMRIDSSGNVGIGTTSPAERLHVYSTSATDAMKIQSTQNYSVASFISALNTNGVVIGTDGAGNAYIENKDTAKNFNLVVGGSERARIDSSGNLGVGTSSPSVRLQVLGAGTTGQGTANTYTLMYESTTQGNGAGLWFGAMSTENTGVIGSTTGSGNIAFQTYDGAWGERMRITNTGNLLVGTTDASGTAGIGFKFLPSATYSRTNQVGSSTSNSDTTHEVYSTGASAYRFYVGYGGTVFATNTTISAISDARFKENIRDLNAGLPEIMALKPRMYDWKEGKGADIKNARGFIAQEFEEVFPDLIDEWKDPAPEGEEPYKSVRQDLIPVLVKAIQEQQALITQLQADVAALKGA